MRFLFLRRFVREPLMEHLIYSTVVTLINLQFSKQSVLNSFVDYLDHPLQFAFKQGLEKDREPLTRGLNNG